MDVFALYQGIERDAFRLETLQAYDVAAEADQVAAFLRGEPLPPSPGVGKSLRVIGETAGSGRRLWRVHIVEVPLTGYLRYELAAYQKNAAAGEQVYLADRAWHADLATLNEDFVLFDDQTVVWYRYDDAGRLLGHERDDSPASLVRCREARDLAVRWAVPLDEFTTTSPATMS
ncbi:MAG: DUF6879 family protein [Egibacteraceae bacterium]